MSLYLITGTAGTGKSQVCGELKRRGFEAYDTDDDGLARWQHVTTGYIHPKSSVKADMRTAGFIAEHTWTVPREHLMEYVEKAADHPIFICGSLGNEASVRDVFAGIFALFVDDEVLTHRLQTRTTNDWGKQPHELAQSLYHHHRVYDQYRKLDVTIIDASQPVALVTDEIIQLAGIDNTKSE